MDICRWGMGEVKMPNTVVSTGGKYVYDDDQETPNTQLATLDYGGREIVFEVRGLLTGPEGGNPVKGVNEIGNLFYGSEGWMVTSGTGFRVYKGEKNEKIMDETKGGAEEDPTVVHMKNFLAACRSRNNRQLNAEVEIGATSAALVHFANISYRVGRKLTWDDAKRSFVNDSEANKLLTREYRKPYVV
jgi:hypothetical protein